MSHVNPFQQIGLSPRSRTRTTERPSFLLNSMRSSSAQSSFSFCEIRICDGSCEDPNEEAEHNQRNQLLELCANYAIVRVLQDCLEERTMVKLALSCHFDAGRSLHVRKTKQASECKNARAYSRRPIFFVDRVPRPCWCSAANV